MKTRALLMLFGFLLFAQTAWSNVFYENSLRHEKKGDYRQALIEWKEAEHTVTENIFYQRSAWLEYLMGHYEAALLYYQKAVSKNQDDITSCLGVINCFSALKKYEQACDFAEYLLDYFPDNLGVRRAASGAYYNAGRYAVQIKMARKFSSDRVINTTRGWSLYQQGKYNSAKAFFRLMAGTAKNDTERLSLKKAAYECEKKEQFTLGMFFTNIQYGLNFPDKRVMNGVFLYSPHKWSQYRFIYGNTDTSDSSFTEDSYSIGYSNTFKKDYTLMFDFMNFSNNDSFSDEGKVFSFQLLKVLSPRFTAALEYDYSNYDFFNVNQFSPRLYCQIDKKTGIEFKTYFINHSENTFFTGDNQAYSLKMNRILRKNFYVNALFWTGDKRFSVESDKSYVYNTPDVYESGYALDLNYRTKRNLAFTLGYGKNRLKTYTTGDRMNSTQWTFGMKLRN